MRGSTHSWQFAEETLTSEVVFSRRTFSSFSLVLGRGNSLSTAPLLRVNHKLSRSSSMGICGKLMSAVRHGPTLIQKRLFDLANTHTLGIIGLHNVRLESRRVPESFPLHQVPFHLQGLRNSGKRNHYCRGAKIQH
jgi:hypothetical protein